MQERKIQDSGFEEGGNYEYERWLLWPWALEPDTVRVVIIFQKNFFKIWTENIQVTSTPCNKFLDSHSFFSQSDFTKSLNPTQTLKNSKKLFSEIEFEEPWKINLEFSHGTQIKKGLKIISWLTGTKFNKLSG